VLRFVLKGVAEGDLEPFFPLGHSVLLHGLWETAPPAFLFGPKDGEVSLFEEFDLVVHVHDAEDESSGGGDVFGREVKPCSVGRVGVVADPELKLSPVKSTTLVSLSCA
jgi:hypothetical protein